MVTDQPLFALRSSAPIRKLRLAGLIAEQGAPTLHNKLPHPALPLAHQIG